MPRPSAAAPTAAEPIPPGDEVAAAARAAFDRRLDPDSDAPIALALSGGGDSLALLWLAADWCAANGRRLVALTVDHGLSPDSAAWTRDAGAAAARAGAAWRGLVWQGAKPASGLPAAARSARHRLLADAAREAGAKVLLTGHTADDVLEGELMRAGDAPTLGWLRGWSPSPAWPEGRGLFLLRPLLDLRRAALRDWLVGRGQTWLDDPANDDPRYARARARRLLRPLGVAAQRPDEGCASGATPYPDDERASEPPPHPSAAQTPSPLAGRRETISLPRSDPSARLLAAALLCAAGTTRPPRGEPLQRLMTRLSGADPVQATLAGARVVTDGEAVLIGRDAGERFRGGLAPIPLPFGAPVVWDGRYELIASEPGWTVGPLAGAMTRLPKAERARLGDSPAWTRGALPALFNAAGVVCLPAPFGGGPAVATGLAAARLAAACGLIAREADITDA